tara:strand:- start:293 stop:565 length:273 start_codon:yes stop_codon:yes gene_type:complete
VKVDVDLKNYTPLRSQNSSPNLNSNKNGSNESILKRKNGSDERTHSTKPREDHSPYSGGIEPYGQKKSDKSRASSGSNFRALNIQIDNQN